MLTFEQIAALNPLPDPEGMSIALVVRMLNTALTDAGIEFGENEFSDLLSRYSGKPEFIDSYRWIDVTAVRGGSEGYYIHISLVPQRHDTEPTRLISTAKTWTWESALEIAAAATRLLNS